MAGMLPRKAMFGTFPIMSASGNDWIREAKEEPKGLRRDYYQMWDHGIRKKTPSLHFSSAAGQKTDKTFGTFPEAGHQSLMQESSVPGRKKHTRFHSKESEEAVLSGLQFMTFKSYPFFPTLYFLDIDSSST